RTARPGRALQRQVVGFRAAGREHDLAGVRVEGVSETLVRLVECGPRSTAVPMRRRWVAERLAEIRQHRLENLVANRRRGGMIEVDRHFGIVRGAFGRAGRRTRVTASRRHPRTLRSTPVPVRFTPEFALSLPLVSDAQISPN